jgi:hypothetical protein
MTENFYAENGFLDNGDDNSDDFKSYTMQESVEYDFYGQIIWS